MLAWTFLPLLDQRRDAKSAPYVGRGNAMKIVRSVLSLLLVFAAGAAGAQTAAKGVDRLYILDCGTNSALDQARWSPGVNVGKPLVLSDNCYLLRHGSN